MLAEHPRRRPRPPPDSDFLRGTILPELLPVTCSIQPTTDKHVYRRLPVIAGGEASVTCNVLPLHDVHRTRPLGEYPLVVLIVLTPWWMPITPTCNGPPLPTLLMAVVTGGDKVRD
ncbi:hypothetical protein EVAR_2447_1 [Eumeta japonica]|uniref:Uncharacterized protein n=1 Tax=Eumeta variegata TaxID=151549 RepID=A0A4C1SP20_EUMVA|nr:hypothetical protein EVAR_2447_1 [Eumeta japonica]